MRAAWRLDQVSGTFVAALYVVLGLGDLVFSLAAFRLGIPEGNPLLRWAAAQGLFVQVKLGLTLFIGVLIGALYEVRRGRMVSWSGIVLMCLLNAYQFASLRAHLSFM